MKSEVGLESITMNKAHEGDGIPVDLFQILKDDALREAYSVCQQIWKVQQQSQDWKSQVFIPIPKKAMPKNVQTTIHLHSFHMQQGNAQNPSARFQQ